MVGAGCGVTGGVTGVEGVSVGGGAGVTGGSMACGTGVAAVVGSSGADGLAFGAAGASGVSKRAVAAALAAGGATTLATLAEGAMVAAGNGLRSDCALGAGTDKRIWAMVGTGACARQPSDVERVCKPSKCAAITNATKPQNQGRGKNDAV